MFKLININIFKQLINQLYFKALEVISTASLFHKVTKSVCTGTRAIVRTLPSGLISEDVWAVVVHYRCWTPSKEDTWLTVKRGMGEDFRRCKEMLCFAGLKLHQVRE